MKFGWEIIDSEDCTSTWEQTARAPVKGGWLVRYTIYGFQKDDDAETSSVSMIFMSDPNHEWCIDDEEVNPKFQKQEYDEQHFPFYIKDGIVNFTE